MGSRPKDDAAQAAWKNSREVVPRKELQNMKPGIYLGLSFQDYQQINAVNRSSLCAAKRSLAHYRYQPEYEDTPAFRFGTLIHAGKLEPELLSKNYVVLPQYELEAGNVTTAGKETQSKNTNYYKDRVAAFMRLHPGKIQVSQEWMDDLLGILKSMEQHPKVAALFEEGYPEVTIVWVDPDTGLLCKARIDWLGIIRKDMPKLKITRGIKITDVKSTLDCTEFALDKYDYHIQGAFYCDGLVEASKAGKLPPLLKEIVDEFRKAKERTNLEFWFAACEKKMPYAIRAAPTAAAAIRAGSQEYQFLLRRVKCGIDKKRYPGPLDPDEWGLSPWYKPLSFSPLHPPE